MLTHYSYAFFFFREKEATHAHLACMITFRKSMIEKKRMIKKTHDRKSMESIVREKAWIVKTLSSLYKDGEHNVIGG